MTAGSKPSVMPILLLSAAGFTILTTEFIIVGLLPAIARDLGVSIPRAGLLVTLFAFTVAALGPFLTAFAARFERKRLFVAALLIFAGSNALAAVAGSFVVMAVARFIPALVLPVFWSLASETAVRITGPERAGKAISMVSFGIVAATIFGIPIGTLIGDAFGWRSAFASLAVLALAKALLLARGLPAMPAESRPPSLTGTFGVLRDPRLAGHVGLSLLVFAGMFTAYTYLADVLQRLAGFDGTRTGWILMGFGAVGLLGNTLGGRLVDRRPLGATVIFCAPLALALVALAPATHSRPLLALVLLVWGIAQSALFTASHARVMKAAKGAPALGASLNISGANAGIGLGAVVGGRVIDAHGLGAVGLAAAAVIGLAIALAWLLGLAPKPAAAVTAEVDEAVGDCAS